MHRTGPYRIRPVAALMAFALASLGIAQGPPKSAVRFTEVIRHDVRRAVEVPGTVVSPTVSLVASEVAGVVDGVLAREGDRVSRGQGVVRIRSRNLELALLAAEAEHKEATARKQLALRNLTRARDLFESTVISQADLDDAFSEFTAWEGRIERLDAEIARVKLDIARCTIRAPFGGTVVEERTEAGQWIGVGDAVAEILAVEDLEVVVPVPEQYFAKLDTGVRATVTFDAVPGLSIEGTLDAVIPRADPRARTFPVKIRLPNSDRRAAPGMIARVSLRAGTARSAMLVPKDALVGDVVYVIGEDDTVSSITVTSGAGIGDWIEVAGDLRPGQRVVTRGNERLFPGQAVTPSRDEYPNP